LFNFLILLGWFRQAARHIMQQLMIDAKSAPGHCCCGVCCAVLSVQVVGTIGPACQSVDVQVAMLEAGMSAAR